MVRTGKESTAGKKGQRATAARNLENARARSSLPQGRLDTQDSLNHIRPINIRPINIPQYAVQSLSYGMIRLPTMRS